MSTSTPDGLAGRLRAAGCVFAEDEAAVLLEEATAAGWDAAELADRVARREAGEPLEYVVGWARFLGRRVAVDPGVFVPRHRTELLVTTAAAHVTRRPAVTVVDLCCGSGALGVGLAELLRADGTPVELHATDVDPAAVACARRNVGPAGGTVYAGDLDAALPRRLRGAVDVLLANVPYVPTAAVALLPPEAREHEHRITLDGGADGLDVLRRVAALAPRWLAPGGVVLCEVGADQVADALAAFRTAGLDPRAVRDDDALAVSATRALNPL